MKILLINPIILKRDNQIELSGEPLGLEYLSSLVKDNNEVKILDGLIKELTYEAIIKEIKEFSPNLIGITASYSKVIKTIKELSILIKENFPDIKIVIGGNAATFLAEYILNTSLVDIVVLGEGEITFKELINYLNNNKYNLSDIDKIYGIAYRLNNTVKFTKPRGIIENLDSLPILDREILLPDIKKYSRTITTSRGCPYGCIYCSTAAFFKKYRTRSLNNVMSEIEYLYSDKLNYSSNFLNFSDDILTFNKSRLLSLCENIKLLSKKLNKRIIWGCNARVDHLDEETLKIMKESGCISMFIGIESGSDRVLKLLNRNYTYQDIIKVINLCNKLNISLVTGFIIGLPYETEEDLKYTFSLIEYLPTITNITLLTAFPGTPIYNNPDKYGLKLIPHEPEKDDIIQHLWLESAYLSKEKILDYYYKAIGLAYKKGKKYFKIMNDTLSLN